jgi:hypothetical protein
VKKRKERERRERWKKWQEGLFFFFVVLQAVLFRYERWGTNVSRIVFGERQLFDSAIFCFCFSGFSEQRRERALERRRDDLDPASGGPPGQRPPPAAALPEAAAPHDLSGRGPGLPPELLGQREPRSHFLAAATRAVGADADCKGGGRRRRRGGLDFSFSRLD